MKVSSKTRPDGASATNAEDSGLSLPVGHSKPRHRRRNLLAVGLLVLAAEIALLCHSAWQETRLREAYLPDLRVMGQQQPSNGPIQILLACRLAQARQYAPAIAAFERGVRAGEHLPGVWLAWAASVVANGDRRSAWAVLEEAKRDPLSASEAHAAIERCRTLPANVSVSDLAAAIDPKGLNGLIAHYTRGSILNGLSAWYGRQHPSFSGVTTREVWAKEQPGNAQAQLLWSEALLRDECYGEAETAFRHTLTLAPESPSTKLGLADSLYHEGRAVEAAKLYAQCQRRDPHSLRALLGIGQIALDKRMLAMSIDVFKKAVKLAPGSADAWIGMGKAYYNQSLDIGDALAAYANAVRLAPGRTDFYPQFADVLRVNSQFADAETYLRKRLAVAPNEASTHYYLAVTLLAHDITPQHQADAEDHLRTSLRLEPRGYEAASHLGRLLVDEKRYAEGMPYLGAALQVDPNDLPTMISLVRAYRGLGKIDEARAAQNRVVALSRYSREIKDLEDALQRRPADASLYQRMAQVYIEEGEPDKARNYLNAVVMLKKYPKQAAKGLKTMEQQGAVSIPLLDSTSPNSKAGAH